MPVDILILKYYLWDRFFINARMNTAQKNIKYQNAVSSIQNLYYEQNLLPPERLDECSFTIFDLETTGFFPEIGHEIISIGAVKVNNLQIDYNHTFYKVINPLRRVSKQTKKLTGLEDHILLQGERFPTIFSEFLTFSKNSILVAHPSSFDLNFLKRVCASWNLPCHIPNWIDSHSLANDQFPSQNNYLDQLIDRYNVAQLDRHHALNDAMMTAEIFIELLQERHSELLVNFTDILEVQRDNNLSKKVSQYQTKNG